MLCVYQLRAEDFPHLPVCVAATAAIFHDACASAGLCLSVLMHYSVYFYMHKDQIYSHECKDEVNCEPEVLTALKVSTEGKGY